MKTNRIRLLTLAALAASILGLTACTSTSYKDPSGAEFSRVSFLNKQSVGKVEVVAGDKRLSIEGYSNEQTEIAAAVAGSVAASITKAVVPVAK